MLKNASWIIVCRIIQSLLAFVVGLVTARYLGPANYGLINYAAAIVAFAAPIMKMGLDSILVNELVNNSEKEGEILGTAITINVISAFISFIGVCTFVQIATGNSKDTLIVCMLYGSSLFSQALEMIIYWYQAKLLSKYMSIVSVISYAIVSAYKIFLLANEKNIRWFAVSQALDYLIIAVTLLILYRKLGGQKLRFSFLTGTQMLSKSKYFIISSMMVSIFAQTDKIMLTAIMNEVETGLYSAAATCSGVASFVFAAILDSARPYIFERKKYEDGSYEDGMQSLYCIIFYLALFQSIFMTMFGGLIVAVLFGNAYSEAVSILEVITWTSIFSYFGAVRNIWLLAEQKQKLILPINISGAVANVILNALMIPKYGAMGAAIASLITQAFTNILLSWIFKPMRPVNSLMLKGIQPQKAVQLILQLSRGGR